MIDSVCDGGDCISLEFDDWGKHLNLNLKLGLCSVGYCMRMRFGGWVTLGSAWSFEG